MRPYGRRSVLVSGWRRRAGYDAALILTEKSYEPREIPVEPVEVPKWRPVVRVSETVVRRRP